MTAPTTSNFDVNSQYFSGQGVVLIGNRDVNGNPMGLRPLGNVSDLKIDIATTVISHKGSQDGQRSIDARLQTETNCTASITLDNWIQANLAKALRGDGAGIVAGTVTEEAVLGYIGLVTGLQYINISNLVLSRGATPLVQYSDPLTPYDFQVNAAAGSIMLNDGSSLSTVNLGTVATAVTVGATTVITVPNVALAGDPIAFQGFTGADADLLNGLSTTVLSATETEVTVAIVTTGKVITVAATSEVLFPADVVNLTAAYTYAAQTLTNALTQPLQNSYLRFEGLNTVDSNSPVVVEIFKFSNDPLKELALISDTFGQFMIEGTVLNDPLQLVGSKYFSVKALV
jgi:hypothetical protein